MSSGIIFNGGTTGGGGNPYSLGINIPAPIVRKFRGNLQSGNLNNNVKLHGADIFYNGQKLISGLQYGITGGGSSIYFKTGNIFDNNSGQLFALPRNFQTEITGGTQTFYNLPIFYDNFSEVYKNGQRLAVEQDYLELGQYDINSGQGIFDTKPYLLYNNSDLF